MPDSTKEIEMAGTIHIETHDGKSFLRTAQNVHSLTHNGKDYLVVNGTHYNANTAPEVIKVLENARESGRTIWVDYGNQDTGRSWNEESDVRGRIGRSTGPIKIPLLIEEGEDGGSSMLEHCIVNIMSAESGRILYRHPTFTPKYLWDAAEIEMNCIESLRMSPFELYATETESGKRQLFGRFESQRAANEFLADWKQFQRPVTKGGA